MKCDGGLVMVREEKVGVGTRAERVGVERVGKDEIMGRGMNDVSFGH